MGDIFLKVLNMSLAAGWLMAVVILLSLIAGKVPRWIVCLLWGLVAIRLVCPFSIESPFSAVPSDEVIPESILSASQHTLQITTGVKPVDTLVNEYLGDTYFEGISVPHDYGNILMSGAGVVWLCGVSGLLLYAVVMNLRLRRKLKEAVLLQKGIWLCDHVGSPFIFGLFHPRIYLPSGSDGSDMEYVIAHEKAHLQRKDHIWKTAAFLLLAVYWFHPLGWAAFLLFCRDLELACDEKVIRDFSMPEKKAYAGALLSCSFRKKVSIAYLLTFGEVGVKKRVKSILNYKKPGFWVLSVSLAACIVIGTGFLTTLPQEHQTGGEILDAESVETRRRKTEIELRQMLLDYDRENIVEVTLILQNYDKENAYANIWVSCKEDIMKAEEQNKIRDLVSKKLNFDVQNINLIIAEYSDGETPFTQMEIK